MSDLGTRTTLPVRDTATRRAWQQILDGALEAYDDQPYAGGERGKAAGIPVDRRCASCGFDRAGCPLAGCPRMEGEA